MRKLFLYGMMALVASAANGEIADRIAAVVDGQVITVSEISQMVDLQFFTTTDRREVLDNLIAQALRYRDVERFGAQDISKDTIEARLRVIQARFASPAAFDTALAHAELTLDEFRALIKRQLQVEAYVQERFSPLIFVSSDEIDQYYRGAYTKQRQERGLPVPRLSEVREEIRTTLKSASLEKEIDTWTTQLRGHANVDIYAWR